ncbi:hypothetical protein DK52_3279 [Brucella abortus]|nr:hypothetical protein DK52_3279 [Brucella abortus]
MRAISSSMRLSQKILRLRNMHSSRRFASIPDNKYREIFCGDYDMD